MSDLQSNFDRESNAVLGAYVGLLTASARLLRGSLVPLAKPLKDAETAELEAAIAFFNALPLAMMEDEPVKLERKRESLRRLLLTEQAFQHLTRLGEGCSDPAFSPIWKRIEELHQRLLEEHLIG